MDGGTRASGRRGVIALKSHALFATPLLIEQLEFDITALGAAIAERRKAHTGSATRYGGWHSEHDLFDWGGSEARALTAALIRLADKHVHDPDVKYEWQLEGWANVLEPGGSHRPHMHPSSYWSAVLFIEANGEGGELVLHDPRLPAIAMHAPHLRFKGNGPELEALVRPKAGALVMFPSWLQHSVAPWHGPGQRVSVAVNLAAKRRVEKEQLPA